MRKIIIGMLMAATAATPVLAQDNSDGWRGRGHRDGGEQRAEQRAERVQERQQAREERQQAREQRQQAAPQPQAAPQQVERQAYRQRQAEAPVQQPQQAVQQQAYRTRQTGTWNRGSDNGQREAYRQQIEQSRRSNEQVRAGMPENYQRRAVENERRYEGQVQGQYRRNNNRDSYRGDRNGTRDYSRGSYGGNYNGGRNTNWNRNWRTDNRYDWQRYRYQNRNVYRPGRYYSPYRNYSYNRLGIGVVLDQLFFGRNYWIADPWQYRLPPAPYGTQWVRYFDDVVLVDVYTGQVLDVIYDFFW
jgi:hypothetical protein